MGKGGHKACDELVVQVEMATATISAGNWSVQARGGRTYAIAGPEHRVDVGFSLRGDYAARYLPHGIFGQSFSSPVIDGQPSFASAPSPLRPPLAARPAASGEGKGS